ncbi:hypothetical protein O181_031232 [Austropuccinia psidii MF-1]|uniref:Sodefrin-like factor n=1 Tax=Austropuccinia psidii MF-1 TaxID=1389203 RepID=A0A9Q3H558_9BASI|nr:hypothetical protein [Austropuccinia psidii MF-1]
MKKTLFLGLSFAFALNASGNLMKISKRDSQPNSHRIMAQCHESDIQHSCAICDGSWPTQDFNCGNNPIHAVALRSLTEQLTEQTWDSRSKATPPADIQMSCKDLQIFSTFREGIQVFYSMETTCQCKEKVEPNCVGANSISDSACNFTKIKYCGVTVASTTCAAKST